MITNLLILCKGGVLGPAKETLNHRVIALHNMGDEGTSSPLVSHIRKIWKDHLHADAYLKLPHLAENNVTEYEHVAVHRCILAARSEYFEELFKQGTQESKQDGLEVYLLQEETAFPLQAYHDMLNFLYTGELFINGEQLIKEVMNLSTKWGHADTISKICSIDRISNRFEAHLDMNAIIFSQLKKDFAKLINNPHYYADMKIELHAPIDEEEEMHSHNNDTSLLDSHIHYIHAHKIFAFQSTYINKAFQSGMQESVDAIISFSDISFEGMQHILQYLYTGELAIQPHSCFEVLVHSLLFELPQLAVFCRTMVTQMVTSANVLEVMSVAELYNDTNMKRDCIKVILDHYDELSKKDEYLTCVADETRMDLKHKYQKRQEALYKKEQQKLKKLKRQKK